MTPSNTDLSKSNGNWRYTPERSNALILKFMVWLSLHVGRNVSRLVLYAIAAYFLFFSPKAGRVSKQYLERALNRPAGIKDRFRHFFYFATTIHDRLFLLNNRFELFDLEIHGEELLRQAAQQKTGLILMGAHLGSFEVLRAIGRQHPELNISILMYQENSQKLNAALKAINPAAVDNIIPLGKMDSMLETQRRLDEGHFIGMLADRGLGNDPTQTYPFLGFPAPFPLGPFRVAAMLKRPVVFMTGLYMGGNRYEIHFEELADFTHIERSERASAIAVAQAKYAERLTHFCRHSPYNWFNFFDFWAPAGKSSS